MTITRSGPVCDVCGKHILPLDPAERVNFFSVKNIKQDPLHCDNKCKEILKTCKGDWKKLPDGPLRQAFEEAEKRRKDENRNKIKILKNLS